MPRVRRKRVDTLDWSERTVKHLESGVSWDFLDGDELTEEELRQAWEELRDELTEKFIRETPGRRPWAWWKWDRGMRPPVDLQTKPRQAAWLNAHGLLDPKEQKAVAAELARWPCDPNDRNISQIGDDE